MAPAAFRIKGKPIYPLHGLLDLRELHRAAGDRAGQDSRGRALRQGLLHRLRRHHRHRRGDLHRQGRAGRQRRGVRPRRHRPQRRAGRQARRRRHDHRRRHQSGAREAGAQIRPDAFRQSQGRQGRPGGAPGRADQRRRRLQLRVHRQHPGDAPGARVLPSRLGPEHHHRRGRLRPGDQRRDRFSWSPAGSGGARPLAARAAAPTCRGSSTGTWSARSTSTT